MSHAIQINRAPVMTLWAAVVAERLGYDWDEAVTLGRVVAGLNAQTKGRRLGLYKPGAPGEPPKKQKSRAEKPGHVELLGRVVPTVRTRDGIRADEDGKPADPAAAHRYLESKFGDALRAAREAMEALARSLPPDELAVQAFTLYEEFRPAIPSGQRGWGAKGLLDLAKIRKLAEETSKRR